MTGLVSSMSDIETLKNDLQFAGPVLVIPFGCDGSVKVQYFTSLAEVQEEDLSSLLREALPFGGSAKRILHVVHAPPRLAPNPSKFIMVPT